MVVLFCPFYSAKYIVMKIPPPMEKKYNVHKL